MGETTRGSGSTIDFSNVSSEKIRFTFGHRWNGGIRARVREAWKESDMCHGISNDDWTIFFFRSLFLYNKYKN